MQDQIASRQDQRSRREERRPRLAVERPAAPILASRRRATSGNRRHAHFAPFCAETKISFYASASSIHHPILEYIPVKVETCLVDDLTVLAIYALPVQRRGDTSGRQRDGRKLQVAEPKQQRFSPARWLPPTRSPRRSRASGAIAPWNRGHRIQIALLALGIFVLDTATSVDIVVPVLYVNVVLLAMRSGRRSDIAIASWASAALTIVSFALTVRPEVHAATALFNTAVSLLAILCVTILCLRSVRSQEEILRTRARLAFVSRGIFLKTLSASVAHRLTGPIAEIGANAATACRSLRQVPPDVEATKAATRRVVREVEQVSAVVGRLRGSMAPRDVVYAICDVRALIEAAVEHLGYELVEAGIGVTIAGASDLRIVADGTLIEQVIVDALSNSVAAPRPVEAERRQILVETKELPGEVQISITDDGVGVDGAALEGIFDPFFTTEAGSGMGVGLAVSKSIIEVHDGTIRALPHSPKGLTIEITLPAARAALPR